MNKKKNIKTAMQSTITAALSLCSAAMLEAADSRIADGTPINDVTFVVFDTETTGWNRENGRIIEIGAVKFKNGLVIAEKSWLINPGILITPDSRRIHGISDEMVSRCPSFKEVFPKFNAFTRDSVLLAHNASFDVRFIRSETERNGLEAPSNRILDTLRLSRKWFPQFRSHSLSNLAKRLNISAGTLHRAAADSRCTMSIFLKGVETMPEGASFSDLIELAGKELTFREPAKKR